ncbi:Alpha/Beta hydrolase protein [Naematelia encephala]|uniref:Alpha/Beta hydrolase protein n=1 Tax=Naematelia encephala TaxID=71784 RepID=A0A1Y2BJU3_9TREE|nr:Alpha/Beta hydrolase protein [Naematelia encephala]
MTGGFGTPSVALATTPTVVSTFFSHILSSRKRKAASRKSLAEGGPGGGPEDQLSYEEGLKLVRRFLDFASHHGVEEVQAFTAMTVPVPHWVRRKVMTIPQDTIERAESIMETHLSTYGTDGGGLNLIGGKRWWRVRGRELQGEWVEMQKDYLRRTAIVSNSASSSTGPSRENTTLGSTPVEHRHHRLPRRSATLGSVKDNSGAEVIGERVILYIHGGAFFFSSLDTHRYQVQRHARKAGARAFCPAYRLSPQYPFPCGLLDALASYLYLIDPPPNAHHPILPTSIILMGDSAGAGMVISLLVIIREMNLPMPAGASLISPWVDLTHSMPSIGGWDGGDFIPSSGFHYKPSSTWPPPPGDGIDVTMPDGHEHHFDEQIQMYCPNNLLTHPLVSPVNLGSLGGLCPLLILGGGGELLRDEIIYLAHKAASPFTYPPGKITLSQYPDQAHMVDRYKPTKVHLQIYEGCCHVVPTLSWCRSAKYMYRSCANFNIWAYTAAAKALEHKLERRGSKLSDKLDKLDIVPETRPLSSNSEPAIPGRSTSQSSSTPATTTTTTTPASTAPGSTVDLTVPIITPSAAHAANSDELDSADIESEASTDSDETSISVPDTQNDTPPIGIVTVRGIEPLSNSTDIDIVSERVSTHGHIRPFEPTGQIPALDPSLKDHIGQVHGSGAIQKWLAKRAEWDAKYATSLKKWREIKITDRVKAEKEGFLTRDLYGENPPLASLVGWFDTELARQVGKSVDEIGGKTSGAMAIWTKMTSKADKEHAGGDNLDEIKENVSDGLKAEQEKRVRRASQSQGEVGS